MIRIIFTGGTIGSRADERGVTAPDAACNYRLLQMYEKYNTDKTEFSVREPYRILSENLEGTQLECLIRETAEALEDPQTEGVVITHGSDTLQYAAAMLQHIFCGSEKAVVLVASNYVLEDPRANGFCNFYFALRFLRERRGRGVFVAYRNPGEEMTIHAGHKLLASESFSDRERSVRDQWYGRYRCAELPQEWKSAEYVANPLYPEEKLRPLTAAHALHLGQEAKGVLWLRPHPGMAYPVLREDVKVVLLDSYHSGTIGITEGLREFLRQVRERKIPVYLCGISREGAEYESISRYRELGIEPVYEETPISVYCRLWLLFSQEKGERS